MPQAGELSARVGFFKPVVADDGKGNRTAGFAGTADFTLAARIVPRLGGEQVLAGRLTGTDYVNITVRASGESKSVTPDWRAIDARTGDVYNIRSIIDPDEGTAQRGRFLELLCEKGVA